MSGSLVVSTLAGATLAMSLALLAVRVARRSRAALRHVLLAASFAVLAGLPMAAAVAPSIAVAVPIPAPAGGGAPAAALVEDVTMPPAPGAAPRPLEAPASRGFSLPSAPVMLFAGWALGAALCLLPLALGCSQIRGLRRSALPWPRGESVVSRWRRELEVRPRVPVLMHEHVAGPMTSGVLRPALMFPLDAARWSGEALDRAIVHELEHVRRRDWLSQCLARLVCAVYWFHPLVWIARRQLDLEAECACDDAVLLRAEALGYADQLVDLAARLSAGHRQPLLAMASRRDLPARVRALLDRGQARGRVGAATVAGAFLTAAALVLALSPVRLVMRARAAADVTLDAASTHPAGQRSDQAAPPQRFEAVSVRPCQDDTPPAGANGGQRSGQGGFPTVSPGRFTIDCGTLERLISNAYVLNGERLENNSPRIGDVSWWKGGPEWIRYDKFTIEASAPGVTDRAVLLGPMLRALLEDRFQLRLHRETADAPMYAMTIAKGGLKIQPMAPGGCNEDRDGITDAASARANAEAVTAGTAKPGCDSMTMMGGPGHSKWTIGGTTLANFAGTLTTWMDHRVIDKTGYDPETKFNIHLEFAPDEHVPGADKRNPRTEFAPADAPTIFAALEQQLGLKLESTKGPQGVLVIDHVEHPKTDGGIVVPMRARGAGR